MADQKGSKASMAPDGADVLAKNAINVAMEDLAKEDQREVKRQLEEEMAELRRKKLVCFQKTHIGVVKKANTVAVTSDKVSMQLSPKDLVHMVDVSVASKYGVDLTQFMCVVAEDMRNMLETFKTDLSNNLPRQVRSVVQHI
jgi:hypothetical protein